MTGMGTGIGIAGLASGLTALAGELGLFDRSADDVTEYVREQRAQVVDGVKKLLKQQQSPTQLAEGWKDIPLLLLFDWFCDWSNLILRYQLTEDEEGLGLADMRKVLQYLAQKTAQGRVLEIQDWILAQRQKVMSKANLNRVLLLEALLVQWAAMPQQR